MYISPKTEAYLFRGTLFVAIIATFVLTLMRTGNLPDLSLNDKVTHFIAFLGLAFLADYSLKPSQVRLLKTLLLLSFGIIIEVAQYFTSWRTADWQDVVADLSGIVIYWLFAPLIMKLAFWREK